MQGVHTDLICGSRTDVARIQSVSSDLAASDGELRMVPDEFKATTV